MQTPLHRFWIGLRARPRLLIALALGILTFLLLPSAEVTRFPTRLILGWNMTACSYIVLGASMMLRSNQATIQRRAQTQDEGKWMILGLVALASVVGLMTVALELVTIKNMTGSTRLAHMALVALTIVASWVFTHMMFGLHYAHDYFAATEAGNNPGLDFPGHEPPDYGDFMYFAFVIGTSGQTADVALTSKTMRRIGALHCVYAFAFNTTILALTINIAAGLLG
jgi:uncharacterized membrane protein